MSRFNKRKYLIDGCPRRAKTILSTYKGLDLKVSNGMKQFLICGLLQGYSINIKIILYLL